MSSLRQLIVFGGFMVCFGSLLPTGEAMAFGQHWRPAPGFGPAQGHNYGGVANMPNFRPRTVARSLNYQRFGRVQPRPSLRRGHWQPYAPQMGFWPGRPAFDSAPRYAAAPYPPPQLAPMGYLPGGWANRRTGFAPAWQPPTPLFARQYAWRPVGQPWVAQTRPARQPKPRYQVRMAPQMVGFRPTAPGYAAPASGWRPATHPAAGMPQQYGQQRHVYQAPVRAGSRGLRTGSMRPPGWPMSGARVAGPNPAPVVNGYWRPGFVVPAAAMPPGVTFRPVAYGRSEAVARDRRGSEATRDKLPGWVTTYQDTGFDDPCGWCSGT